MRDTILSRVRIAVVVGCIAVGAFLAAGCGGGDSNTTTGASGSAPLSKDEFVSQANSICEEGNQQVEALQAPPQNASGSEVSSFLSQGLAIARDLNTKLEALTPPSELQDERDTLVADTKKKLALTEQAIAAAKANDISQAQALFSQIQKIDNKDDALARSIGITECARSVSPQG